MNYGTSVVVGWEKAVILRSDEVVADCCWPGTEVVRRFIWNQSGISDRPPFHSIHVSLSPSPSSLSDSLFLSLACPRSPLQDTLWSWVGCVVEQRNADQSNHNIISSVHWCGRPNNAPLIEWLIYCTCPMGTPRVENEKRGRWQNERHLIHSYTECFYTFFKRRAVCVPLLGRGYF